MVCSNNYPKDIGECQHNLGMATGMSIEKGEGNSGNTIEVGDTFTLEMKNRDCIMEIKGVRSDEKTIFIKIGNSQEFGFPKDLFKFNQ
jgi:hypothetical protein